MLGEVDFELRPSAKYTVPCPRCGDFRNKRGTKTLVVYRDAPNNKGQCFIRWQCMHGDQCEYNDRHYALDDRTEALEGTMDTNLIKPVKSATVPSLFQGNPLWWYRNDEGDLLYAVMRKDNDSRKTYHPVLMQADGSLTQIPNWPAIKGFYGQENLKDRDKVLIVEGEKAADAAQLLFPLTAVITWRGGSGNLAYGDFARLDGKTVYLWPDNDEPGRKAMAAVLEKLGECEVFLVDTSSFPEKSDLADNLDFNEVKKALKDAKKVKEPLNYYSTLDTIAESAKLRGPRFMTGWDLVDERVKLPMSGMVVVEGRTGHGKTAFGINLLHNVIKRGDTAYYFSFEIPEDEVIARLLRLQHPSLDLEDAIRDLCKEHKLPATANILSAVENKKLIITDPKKRLNATTLKTLLNNPRMNGAFVVVDYAQKIPTSKVDARQGLVDLMDQVELLAKEHGFLVLMLCQLTPYYPDPLLDAPAESKSIHYNADTVLRVWKKHPQWNHLVYDEVPGNYVVDIRKNRNGESDQLLGFLFDSGATLEPNNSKVKTFKPTKGDNKSATALERIADSLDVLLNKGL